MEDPIASLLAALHRGEPGARDALFEAAYPDLCRLARSRLRDGGRGTLLDTGVLVHETYLRLTSRDGLQADHRRAFFAYAAQVMRSVVVDTMRERLAQRRGGDAEHLTLDTALGERLASPSGAGLIDVHEALEALAAAEPRLAQVVELKFFGGYDDAEVAEALDLAVRTVRRDWAKAQRLLAVLLADAGQRS